MSREILCSEINIYNFNVNFWLQKCYDHFMFHKKVFLETFRNLAKVGKYLTETFPLVSGTFACIPQTLP
jgi:hypothetical protein